MTVKELKEAVDKLVEAGYGDYKVVVQCRDSGGDYFGDIDEEVRLREVDGYFEL